MSHHDHPILKRPYSERQLIAIAADEVIAAEREAKEKSTSKSEGVDWTKVAKLTLAFFGGPTRILTEVTIEAIKAWNRVRASGFPVLTITRTDAMAVKLPPGHPRDGVLYVGHPAIPSVYYTPALFHRLCFEHKFCEAINLLMDLGATEISVEHISGWSKEFSANLSVPLGATEVGTKAGSSSKAGSQLLYKATLAGTENPSVPSNLVWYPHEPTWHQIAEGRLKFGLKDFSLSVRYEDDFGINAGLKTAVTKAGLDLGGKFEDHQSTVWRIDGKFSSMKSKHHGRHKTKRK